MVSIVHITDLHLDADAETALIQGHLQQALAEIASLSPPADLILFSGDLVDRGDEASYAQLSTLMADAPCPVLYAMGNHDDPSAFMTAFPEHPKLINGRLDHAQVVAGQHVVTLDTSRRGLTSGDLDDAQLAWLDAQLSEHADLPKWIMMHHPPALAPDAPLAWQALTVDATDRLAQVLTRHDVQGAFVGHVHCDRVIDWPGGRAMVSRGLHSRIDWRAPKKGLKVYPDPGFALIEAIGTSCVVTYYALELAEPDVAIPQDVLAQLQ